MAITIGHAVQKTHEEITEFYSVSVKQHAMYRVSIVVPIFDDPITGDMRMTGGFAVLALEGDTWTVYHCGDSLTRAEATYDAAVAKASER